MQVMNALVALGSKVNGLAVITHGFTRRKVRLMRGALILRLRAT